MEKRIAVVDADENQCQELCALLEEKGYQTTPMDSIRHLERYLKTSAYPTVILDLDTIPVDNRVIRELIIKNPGIYILGLSKDRYHPELRDAICYHIFACINKPLVLDELFYWLKCIYENDIDPKYQTET